MANTLSDQYKSVFYKSKHNLSELTLKRTMCPELNKINPARSDLLDAIKSMDPTSAPGPDNIPAHIYTNCAEELVEPIMKIWKLPLETSKMPEGTYWLSFLQSTRVG